MGPLHDSGVLTLAESLSVNPWQCMESSTYQTCLSNTRLNFEQLSNMILEQYGSYYTERMTAMYSVAVLTVHRLTLVSHDKAILETYDTESLA